MARAYDWEAVERDYRLGLHSLRELSARHGPSEGAIRKKAKAEGWSKDLSAQIRQRVREKACRAAAPEDKAASDAEIVETAADACTEIIRGHQRLLMQAKTLAETLMDRLGEQLEKGTMTVQLKSGETDEVDVPLDYAGKTLGNATMALERVVRLERQAYGLDEAGKEQSGKSLDELMAEVAE